MTTAAPDAVGLALMVVLDTLALAGTASAWFVGLAVRLAVPVAPRLSVTVRVTARSPADA